jgi:type II secretory pathway pseudopilin PulG
VKNFLRKLSSRERKSASSADRQGGFTLFEILIVLAFMAIMGTIGVGYYLNYYRQTTLKTTVDEMIAFVYETQQKSINQQDSSQWGVHFENPAGDGAPFYASFTGGAYGTASDQKYLDNALDFVYPADGESVDVIFNKITGKVSDSQFKKIYIQLKPGVSTKAIKISPAGVVSQDNGEVGWWKFDEGTGTITADSSGFGNKGTITGNVVWLESGCKGGNSACLDFSSGGFVDFGTSSHFSLPGIMTMSAWINLDGSASTYTIGGRAGASTSLTNYWMDIRSSNTQIYFGGYTPAGAGTYVLGSYTFAPGTWYHLAGVDDGSELKIYVNGREEASGGRADRITNDWSATAGRRGDITNYFDGKIDDFRLYDRALTEDEVKELYESTK